MLGWTMFKEQLTKRVEDIAGVEFTFDTDRQALSGELIDDAEHAEDFTVMRPVLDEIIRPDMAFVSGSQTDA